MAPHPPVVFPLWQRCEVIAAAGAVLAVASAALLRGRVHADELFQFLEPAHYLATGGWIKTWEWEQGLRNWAVPGTLGGLLAALQSLGVTHPWAQAAAVWLVCAGAQALGTVALFRLAEEVSQHRATAAGAAWLFVTWGGFVVYAARPLGDALSLPPLLWAFLWGRRALQRASMRGGLLLGLCLGLAFVIRYPSAVFALPIAGYLLARRRWVALAAAAGSGLACLLLLALLDWATWGVPLHSAWTFFHFNVWSGGSASEFGEKPLWWYLPIFAGMAPVLLLFHFIKGLVREPFLATCFFGYFFVFNLLPHKEARFLLPLLPLFVAIAAGPLSETVQRARPSWKWAILYAATSLAAATVLRPFGVNAGAIDAAVKIGRDPQLSGLLVAGLYPTRTGGRFYLGRNDIPLFFAWQRPRAEVDGQLALPAHSHVLVKGDALDAERLAAAGFSPWHSFGEVAVWKRTFLHKGQAAH